MFGSHLAQDNVIVALRTHCHIRKGRPRPPFFRHHGPTTGRALNVEIRHRNRSGHPGDVDQEVGAPSSNELSPPPWLIATQVGPPKSNRVATKFTPPLPADTEAMAMMAL